MPRGFQLCQWAYGPEIRKKNKQAFLTQCMITQTILAQMRSKTYWICSTFVLLFFSCDTNKDSQPHKDPNVAVYVAGEPVLYQEIDQLVRQQLYDQLSQIYQARLAASKQVIHDKLLGIDASNRGISQLELIDSLYSSEVTDVSLFDFIERNGYQESVPVYDRGLLRIDSKSERGNAVIVSRFKRDILNNYVESLKEIYEVEILMTPPTPPVVRVENLLTHSRGNIESKVTFLEVSDLECSMCREYSPVLNLLYEKYKDEVKFSYTHFGSHASIAAIATECAARQGKFWAMKDSINAAAELPDIEDINRMAANINLNINDFARDFEDYEIRKSIEDNINILDAAGIYGTPTILINDQLIFNSSSIEEIENILQSELARLN